MAKMIIGTEEVKKIMYGTEELTTLAIGEWSFPVGGDDYASKPFTIEVTQASSLVEFRFWMAGNVPSRTYLYSINGESASAFTFDSGNTQLNLQVSEGDIIEFAVPSDQNGTGHDGSSYLHFASNGAIKYKAYGNIMSLCYVNYINATTIPNDYCFMYLFTGNTSLVDVENLVLPATALTRNCYMGMFKGCKKITKSPSLNANSLVYYCYGDMFNGCRLLEHITCLATDISANYCLQNWVNTVPANGTFVKKKDIVFPTGNNGIPSGWTVVEK